MWNLTKFSNAGFGFNLLCWKCDLILSHKLFLNQHDGIVFKEEMLQVFFGGVENDF